MNAGSKIAGRYLVEGRVGVGGMSTVMLALDERLERHVAVKLLAEHLADDPSFVSRFRREALAAARLVHPNIVQVFDFGFDSDSHQHFIVMEYVSGQSCAELLRDRGHLDIDQAVQIVAQACRGLEYAHRNGVVHRDVKPGNLLVSDHDLVKLADFGIARATGQSSITQVGSVLGTAAYLSPEQTRGEEAGPYADLYSLGVVTYQLISGRLPYEATSLSELALKQQRELPTPLRELNPRVPPELSEAVGLAISVVPDERPENAAALSAMFVDGARGVAPSRRGRRTGATTAMTEVGSVGPSTAETVVVAGAAPAVRAAAARTPRTVPANRPARSTPARGQQVARPGQRAPARQRQQAAPNRAGRRLALLIGLLLLLVVVIVVTAVLASSHSAGVAHYERIVSSDAQGAIDQLRSLIHQNTKK